MPARIDPPHTFRTEDPAALRRDLDQLGAWLRDFSKSCNVAFQPRFRILPKVVTTGSALVGLGDALQVAPMAGVVIYASLPKPATRDAGATVALLRLTTGGAVNVTAGGAKINGETDVDIISGEGLTIFTSDGTNYYTDPGGVI